jgi:hypothetical protein
LKHEGIEDLRRSIAEAAFPEFDTPVLASLAPPPPAVNRKSQAGAVQNGGVGGSVGGGGGAGSAGGAGNGGGGGEMCVAVSFEWCDAPEDPMAVVLPGLEIRLPIDGEGTKQIRIPDPWTMQLWVRTRVNCWYQWVFMIFMSAVPI